MLSVLQAAQAAIGGSVQRISYDKTRDRVTTTSLGFWERLKFLNSAFRTQIAIENARALGQALNQLQAAIRDAPCAPVRRDGLETEFGVRPAECSPAAMKRNRTVHVTKQFVSSILGRELKHGLSKALFDEVKEKLLASRLGITTDEMKRAQGLDKWALASYAYNVLARSEEQFSVHASGELGIKYQGAQTRWSDVPVEARRERPRPALPAHAPAFSHLYYDYTGITRYDFSERAQSEKTHGDVFHWPGDKLRPLFQEKPEETAARGGGYTASVCTTTTDKVMRVARGDHGYLRMRGPFADHLDMDPEAGAIPTAYMTPVSIYRPEKTAYQASPIGLVWAGHDQIKPGWIVLDSSEYSDHPWITELPVALNHAQFNDMQAEVEWQHVHNEPFNLAERNCTRWPISLLYKTAGIDMLQPFRVTDEFFDSAEVAQQRAANGGRVNLAELKTRIKLNEDQLRAYQVVYTEKREELPLDAVISPKAGKREILPLDEYISPMMAYSEVFARTWGLFVPYQACSKVYRKLPVAVTDMVDRLCHVGWNLVQVFLGAAHVHEMMQKKFPKQKAPFEGWQDALTQMDRPSEIVSPWRVGQHLTPAVKAVRKVVGIPEGVQPHAEGQKELLLIPRSWVMTGWTPPDRRPVAPLNENGDESSSSSSNSPVRISDSPVLPSDSPASSQPSGSSDSLLMSDPSPIDE
ncbi:MAG: hypothetical protein ACOYKZ_03660 [Chlamydiia bacterium]